jgi:hypothetical protein
MAIVMFPVLRDFYIRDSQERNTVYKEIHLYREVLQLYVYWSHVYKETLVQTVKQRLCKCYGVRHSLLGTFLSWKNAV